MAITSPTDVQLILAYSWARPAILVAGKGRGGKFFYFFCFFTFIPVPLSSLSLSSLLLSLLSSSPFLWEASENDPQGLTCRYQPIQMAILECVQDMLSVIPK